MSVKNIDSLQKLIDNGICNRCGSCVGLSDGKIIFNNKEGRYLPQIIELPDRETMDVILEACSGKAFNFPLYNTLLFGSNTPKHIYTGAFRSINIGYSIDPKIRLNAASGGIISALLIYLLRTKEIDGAVVLGMSKEKPWLTQPFIASTEDEILEAAQSKYILSSVNEILPEISAFKGRLAYVGLPGQVQSIRALQRMNHPSVKNICYIFGPFYGNTLHFSSIKSFLRSYGEYDYKKIKKLFFRHGEWPGNMRVELNNGKVLQLKKFHANYLIPFHIVKNSLICTDLTNEFTDVSGGDAWAPVYEERGKGFSMVIGRSEKGEALLKKMQQDGFLNLSPLSLEESIAMHSHGYDLKKRGSFIRMNFLKWIGKPIPDYGYQIKDFSFSRYLMEFFIDLLFLLLGTSFARWIVEQFSPTFVGRVFEKSRNIWKKSTKNIKRQNL
ncbi:MAG: coenzyme F420 hydrogenase [Bacteroidetes bacterium HGW-Bacteroidetes-1]|jgi:coenzyme F420 hydrogenase subunit beta|nr:MAG: coenzyme F420 hydrogenase [Bacteroidetes bacterium HGW-Bacteroidetes-1]